MKHSVKMLQSVWGVDEGNIHPSFYKAGETYEIGEELMACFINDGQVETVSGWKAIEEAQENKAIKAAPENKKKNGSGKK